MQNEESNPAISICIPTYNGAKYLSECVNHVLTQTYINFEIIICDDCSTDDTESLIKNYRLKDKRIKFFRNERNLGLCGNWNRCVEHSQGKWIKFIFQDDWMNDNCLETFVRYIKDDTSMLICEREYIVENDVDAKTRKLYKSVPRLYSFLPKEKVQTLSADKVSRLVIKKFPSNFIGEPCSVMFRKSAFEKFGHFSSDIAQICDLEYWIRIGTNTGFIYINEKLINFRVHPASTSVSNNAKRVFTLLYSDKIETIQRFLTSPVYENFRGVIGGRGRWILKQMLLLSIYRAYNYINKNKWNLQIKDELEQIMNRYSKPKIYFINNIMYYVVDRFFYFKRRLGERLSND